MTFAKDTLNTLLWLPINSIPLCLHREPVAGSTPTLQRAERPAIAVMCTAYTSAKDLIGAYVLSWHSAWWCICPERAG